MTATEKQEMLLHLTAGGKALMEALNHLPEEHAATRPAPDRWSVLEVLEHLALVEENLFRQVLSAQDAVEPVGSSVREQKIRARATDRSRHVDAPATAVPTGRFATVNAATRAFVISRERTLRFVDAYTGDLRAKVANHPVIGPVNCYEMLLMMGAHPLRHALQIAEIRAAVETHVLARGQAQG